MKIKDTPIAEKLPEKKHASPYSGSTSQHFQCIGYNQAFNDALNTDIDINEVAEIDVEKALECMNSCQYARYLNINERKWVIRNLAKAGVLKWKEKKNGKS